MARPRTEPRPETDTGQTGGFPSLADVTPGPLALTGLNQPLWLQNSTYPAALDRQAIAAAFVPGVLGSGSGELAVTQRAAGANLSVDVAAGRVVVPMTDAPNQGSALCVSTAVNNLVVGGAPGAGLSRIDLVIARVYDASLIGGSINGWQLEIVAGTPAASPAAPALPTSSIELARVAVAAGQASVQTANITDRRVIPGMTELSYGTLTANLAITTTVPTAPHEVIPGTTRVYDGSPVWLEFFSPTVVTPAVANGSILIAVWDGATDVGYIAQIQANSTTFLPVYLRRKFTPSAGTHNYRIMAHLGVAGTGAMIGGGTGAGTAGSFAVGYGRITRA